MSVAFEKYVRATLVTGCSAKAARGIVFMSAKTFLSEEGWQQLEMVLPLDRWFQKQREGLGYEAWTYAMIRVARAKTILQWGFDETKLDGVSTMNQWVLLQEEDNAPKVVTFEAAGLTVGETAQRTAEHVRKTWELGQQAVLLVRVELGPEVCDELVPLVEGGVLLHKIEGASMTLVLRQIKYLTLCEKCAPRAGSCITVTRNALTKHATYPPNSAAKQAAKSQAPPKSSATPRATCRQME
jgi:hypothetical protein